MKRKGVLRLQEICGCIDNGLTQSETARFLQITPTQVSYYKRKAGLVFPYKGRGQKPRGADSRSIRMAALYKSGKTLQQIGTEFGITRERVRQIIGKYHGMNHRHGGLHIQTIERNAAKIADRDARYLAKYGCTFAQWKYLLSVGKRASHYYRSPLGAYVSQRNNAKRRGIGWELTVWQWWTIWQESGHWEQRGRGQGYCMCRHGDTGPYATWNVFIALAAENSSNRAEKKSPYPRGVEKTAGGYFAKRHINNVPIKLGPFPSVDEAFAAYLAASPERSAAA